MTEAELQATQERLVVTDADSAVVATVTPEAIPTDDTPAIKSLSFGSEVKYNGVTGEVSGYLVLFGDQSQADFDGDFFTKDTDFDTDFQPVDDTNLKALPTNAASDGKGGYKLVDDVYGDAAIEGVAGQSTVYFNHTLDPVIRDHKLGGGKKATLTLTEKGIWVQARLKEADQYDQMVIELMKARQQRGRSPGWSSGVPGHLVTKTRVKSDGGIEANFIKRWPLGTDASITHSPNDWRNTATLKTLTEYSQALTAEQESDERVTEAELKDALHPTKMLVENNEPMENTLKMTSQELDRILKVAIGAVGEAIGVKMTDEQLASAQSQAKAAMHGADCPPDDPDCADDETVMKTIQSADFVQMMAKIANDVVGIKDNALRDSVKATINSIQPVPSGHTIPGVVLKNAQISVSTKYHDLSAEDMAYVDWVQKQYSYIKHAPYDPGEAFYRELAAKATKSYDAGKYRYLPTGNEGDLNSLPRAMKTINAIKSNELDYSTQVGYGDEWVADLWSSELWMRDRLDNVVYSRFRPVDMPSNPYELPLEAADPTVYKVPEATNQAQLSYTASVFTQSKMATDKATLTAYKIGLQTPFDSEMNEDSIIQFAPELRSQATWAMTNAIEYDLLQADNTAAATGNINKSDSTVNAGDLDKWMIGFKGAAFLPLVTDTTRAINFNGSPTLQKLRSMRSKFGAGRIGQLQNFIYVTDPVTAMAMLNISEMVTLDKYGPNATVLTGEIGKIDSIPVLQTANFGLALATGKISNTAASNTLGRVLLIHTPSYRVGYRRQIQMGVDFIRAFDAYIMTATVRFGLVQRDADASVIGYNLAV